MRNKIIKLLAIAAAGSTCWLAVNLYDSHTIKKGIPPGYLLECDGKGNYRPCKDGRPLVWIRGPGSKAQAIRRAWQQVEWDAEDATANWKPCNDR